LQRFEAQGIERYMRFWQIGFAALLAFGLLAGLAAAIGRIGPPGAVPVPAPAQDEALAAPPTTESVVLAGGCFWGVQAVYEHVRGVVSATAGYAGGSAATADYDDVSTGATGHAESVRVVYDPRRVTLGRLLEIFFSVVQDPTQWNRQGPDVGSQYRSAIFYHTPAQQRLATAYIRQLTAAHTFRAPIVTEVVPLPAFYPAEAYHQDYAARHPDEPYIQINDLPKLANLRRAWPRLYRPSRGPAPVNAAAHSDRQR
jgi:peptide-methionine (S)-S-oxide reductase